MRVSNSGWWVREISIEAVFVGANRVQVLLSCGEPLVFTEKQEVEFWRAWVEAKEQTVAKALPENKTGSKKGGSSE